MYRIWRGIDISFAHHVRGHTGACVNVHGHTWRFEVVVAAHQLDREGFVVDFGRIKKMVLEPCFDLLDHSLALGEDSFRETESALVNLGIPFLKSRVDVHGKEQAAQLQSESYVVELAGAKNVYPGGMKVALFPFSPTSERLAAWLFRAAQRCVSHTENDARIERARVYESMHPVHSVAEYAEE